MSEEDTKVISEEQKDKLRAEAAKIRAETVAAELLSKLNVTKVEAEIAKLTAETANAAAMAKSNQLNLDQQTRQEEAALAADLFHCRYHFNDSITESSVRECINRLTYWQRTRPGADIEIIFDSPGGSVFDGLALYDFIQEVKRSGHNVTTHTIGMAASMAGILLQAGTTRRMAKEAWVLIHEISTLAYGKSSSIEDEVAFIKRVQERVLNIFFTKAKEAHAADSVLHPKPPSMKTLQEGWKRKDWWLDSDECLKMGLVDEIV